MFWNRHEVYRVQAHTVCATQIDKNKHNRTFYNGVGGRTSELQNLFKHYCSLARNTWYSLVQPWSRPGKVQMCCGIHTSSKTHRNVRALSHKVKCDCSVQTIRNKNNLTASKRATRRCWTFCIVQETGMPCFSKRPQRQWHNWRRGKGAIRPPWQTKSKNWPPFSWILVFSMLLIFSRLFFLFFWGAFVFYLASIDIYDIRIHYYFVTFFERVG